MIRTVEEGVQLKVCLDESQMGWVMKVKVSVCACSCPSTRIGVIRREKWTERGDQKLENSMFVPVSDSLPNGRI